MDANILLWLLAGGLVAAGVAGTLLPVLPGAPLVFGGLLLAAWIDGFQRVGVPTLVLLGILTIATFAVDIVAASLGAKRVGASRAALTGAALGTVLGLGLGIVGVLVGPFVGAVAGELYARRDVRQAGRVGVGTWLGLLFGTLLKLALVLAMLGVFVTVWLW